MHFTFLQKGLFFDLCFTWNKMHLRKWQHKGHVKHNMYRIGNRDGWENNYVSSRVSCQKSCRIYYFLYLLINTCALIHSFVETTLCIYPSIRPDLPTISRTLSFLRNIDIICFNKVLNTKHILIKLKMKVDIYSQNLLTQSTGNEVVKAYLMLQWCPSSSGFCILKFRQSIFQMLARSEVRSRCRPNTE